ncbi:hypothetical protein IQ260_09275 [Leptolyngbya cf. ectocarpi LEGE 11479]|uniref:Uncharacterized protein n=1 Tax=Leptolyngbya cf. ectocarpi LEGE 11479 TaxID=1828722 RepID=A0A928X493_LEPEC|nr:hypothetical protein [Leptolyngbya ectocarpi]MBE9066843.1 hypothetical protein [Leptolyngbya cf. ectocarpi LEGE 11479]
MRHHQDEVKVAVYSAQMAAPEQQRAQDVLLALMMGLSAIAVMGLRYYYF